MSSKEIEYDDGLQAEQIAAIRKSVEIALQIKSDHPEIAILYRTGSTLPELAQQYIHEEDVFSSAVAELAIRYAIRGFHGGFGLKEFSGLITDRSELEKICEMHRKQGGHTAHITKVGVHGMTTEKKREICRKLQENQQGIFDPANIDKKREGGRKTGKIYGIKSYQEGKGIFAQTREELHTRGKRMAEEGRGFYALSTEELQDARMRGVLAQGKTPWIPQVVYDGQKMSEADVAYTLSQQTAYLHQKGRRGGEPNLRDIARELNRLYHDGEEIRTRRSVNARLVDYRKALK